MTTAQCSCGALKLEMKGPSAFVVACHCIECQRRTGSPFGVGAFYAVDSVTFSGTAKEYVRGTASGQKLRTYFCPDCGSSVYWKADKHPTMVGVATGAIADPAFHAPDRSVFEQSKHHWVEIGTASAHFPQGSAPAPAK